MLYVSVRGKGQVVGRDSMVIRLFIPHVYLSMTPLMTLMRTQPLRGPFSSLPVSRRTSRSCKSVIRFLRFLVLSPWASYLWGLVATGLWAGLEISSIPIILAHTNT